MFALARGTPAKLIAATRECVDELATLRGQWTAQQAGVDAVLDSIHTERENVQKAHNRLSAREGRGGPQVPEGPESRDDLLRRLRPAAGIGSAA